MLIACALFENNITSDPDDYAAMVRVGWAFRPPARADGDEIRAAHVSKRLDTRTILSWAVRSLTVAALIGERQNGQFG